VRELGKKQACKHQLKDDAADQVDYGGQGSGQQHIPAGMSPRRRIEGMYVPCRVSFFFWDGRGA
jgi:hypothetical protein